MPPQAPKPGIIPLRPLGVGELLDGAFTTIRRYPGATLLLAFSVMIVIEAVNVATNYSLLHGVVVNHVDSFGNETANNDYLARLYTADGIQIVADLVASALLTGMLSVVLGQAVLGRPMSFSAAWAKTRPLFLRLLGATVLTFLAWVGAGVGALPGIVFVVLGVATNTTGVVALGFVLGIPGMLLGIAFMLVKLYMVTPSIALERLTIRAAFRRSWNLVKGSFWRTLGIALLAAVMAGIISGIIVAPFGIIGGTFSGLFSGHPEDQFRFTALLLTAIGGLIGGTLVRPFQAGVAALLYIDRRMRSEALDLTLQQAAAAPNP
jgi:hypothetical protein